MFADDLRTQFVNDVIIPLCEKYGKPAREGWLIYQDAYYQHRKKHGSFASVPNRDERMLERISYMMAEFFKWVYTDPELLPDFLSLQNTQDLIPYNPHHALIQN